MKEEEEVICVHIEDKVLYQINILWNGYALISCCNNGRQLTIKVHP